MVLDRTVPHGGTKSSIKEITPLPAISCKSSVGLATKPSHGDSRTAEETEADLYCSPRDSSIR
jgi:hypothetical protein